MGNPASRRAAHIGTIQTVEAAHLNERRALICRLIHMHDTRFEDGLTMGVIDR